MSSIWKVVARQYRHNRIAFVLGIAIALVPAISGVLLLGVSGWFITAAGIAGVTGTFLNFFAPSAIIRALAILRTAGRYGERMLTHDATFRFLTDLRNSLFSATAAKGATGQRSGVMLNRLTLDIAALDKVYLRLVVPLVLFLSIALILLLVWLKMPVAIFACGTVFLMIWFGLAVYAVRSSDPKTARRADSALDAMRLRATDLAAGRRDLFVYGGLEPVAASILVADNRLEAAEEIEDKQAIRLTVYSTLIGQLFLAAMLLAAVITVDGAVLTPAIGVGLVLVVMALPEIFSQILPGLVGLRRVALASGRLNGSLERAHLGDDMNSGKGTRPKASHDSIPVLSFENVSFRYPGAEQDVLERLSFDISQGEVVAIAGRSGSGKSTVASLTARLMKPDSGGIFLKSADIRIVPENILRQKITVLSQRPYLFNDTVAANLRIAKPDATDTELWVALAQAALATRISNGEKGLETVLGEGGLGLSGGEQRRLALARAFLTSPDLFVLDEMTEGLDEDTASDVLERFLSFKGPAAALMIAHKRLELESADRILRLRHLKTDSVAK
ncbi:MAG: thiol reductant ABC exporter subunit CydC [Roseibium sp.]